MKRFNTPVTTTEAIVLGVIVFVFLVIIGIIAV